MDEDACSTQEVEPEAAAAARATRASRWLKDETMTLVHAKRLYEHEAADAANRGQVLNKEQKWKRISKTCEESGVVRDASQCRKRWQNVIRDYKRVKAWESKNSRQSSYWLMSVEAKRAKKADLPPVFDRDIYLQLDHFMANRPGLSPTVYDSERVMSGLKRTAEGNSPSVPFMPADICPTLLQVPNDVPSPNDDQLPSSAGKRKRSKTSGISGDESLDRLEAMLERNTKLLVEMQERICEKQETRLDAMVDAIREMTSVLNRMVDKL